MPESPLAKRIAFLSHGGRLHSATSTVFYLFIPFWDLQPFCWALWAFLSFFFGTSSCLHCTSIYLTLRGRCCRSFCVRRLDWGIEWELGMREVGFGSPRMFASHFHFLFFLFIVHFCDGQLSKKDSGHFGCVVSSSRIFLLFFVPEFRFCVFFLVEECDSGFSAFQRRVFTTTALFWRSGLGDGRTGWI